MFGPGAAGGIKGLPAYCDLSTIYGSPFDRIIAAISSDDKHTTHLAKMF